MSGGKYGLEALWVLFGLCAVLLLETHRAQLEVLVQTVERYEYLIPSNALVASSVVGAIALLPALGVIAFPVANGIGLLMGNHWVQRRLRNGGFGYRNDWLGTGLVVACSLAASGGRQRLPGWPRCTGCSPPHWPQPCTRCWPGSCWARRCAPSTKT